MQKTVTLASARPFSLYQPRPSLLPLPATNPHESLGHHRTRESLQNTCSRGVLTFPPSYEF